MSSTNGSFLSPESEKLRLKALYEYDILDTVSESEYDSITKIAAGICNVQVSLMTLLDNKRQWFKSRFGYDINEIPREFAFCNYTLMDPQNVLVVPDLRADNRFSHNPLVTNDPGVVFYAGAPLINPDGHVLGSICVYDTKINHLDESQKAALAALALQVMNSLELRKKIRELKHVHQRLRKVNKSLKKFAHIISHDMKTPLASISMLTSAVEDSYDNALNPHNRELLSLIHKNAKGLQEFIDQMLLQSIKLSRKRNRLADPHEVLSDVISLVASSPDIEITVAENLPELFIDKTALQQILQNLITNAIKYNDKKKVMINITAETDTRFHHLKISDNGSGIAKEDLKELFREHKTLVNTDRFGNKGTGIGLFTLKNILKSIDGNISVASKIKQGSVFTVSIPKKAC